MNAHALMRKAIIERGQLQPRATSIRWVMMGWVTATAILTYLDRLNLGIAGKSIQDEFEIPLKTIVRGYSWTVIPITWRNRRSGVSKLKIREMGSRYLFIALYCWLEKYFSRGDYVRKSRAESVSETNVG